MLAGGSSGSGFFQKKSGSLPSISLWDRLDGAGYVCKNNSRPVFKYPPRGGNGGNQLAYSLALGLGAAVLGKAADSVIGGLIDLVLGIPHILLLVLISYGAGKGFRGVIIGISLTHWTSLARLLRAEALQVVSSQYVQIARRLGKGPWYLAGKHLMPHLIPQMLVGTVLLFPHAILHEASITFLGFGLPPEQPAIGVILSESMKYLSMGRWWLALFPGLLLVAVVLMFHAVGQAVSGLLDPGQAQK